MTKWDAELKRKEMVLNANKSKVMHFCREEYNVLVDCREDVLEMVEE